MIAFAKIGERGMLRGSCNPKGCLDKVEKNKIRKSKELYEHYEHALELADEK
ncbi:MAG: hypothetical protein SBU_000371 [Candidatus Syntrophoarchaeum butanivorans]|uniref:Uncharacterized protein n=1 Tax=Candidatus Syntropharchaeum butanivorans TaxID=1839936 RepID=A0A1F2P772_9EURY|nr:MAG: hypothetical protein SBU_000371 [Candidatus Syntrophoarchaeum butanivorans]